MVTAKFNWLPLTTSTLASCVRWILKATTKPSSWMQRLTVLPYYLVTCSRPTTGATNRLSYTMIKTKYMKLLKKTTLTCTNTTVDIDNATCDVNVIGEQKPINKDVIKLTILDKVGGTAISNPIDIKTTNISKLNSVVLNYKNNMGNTKDFTIMVPVKVTYTWGTVSAKVAIAVDGTIANR